MKPTPGYPGNPLPPVRVETEQTPRSVAPGEVRLSGNGWRVSAPVAVLASLVAAFGVKMLPTENRAEADTRAEQRLEAMRNAEFREEMRRSLAATSDRISRLETELSSLRISVEAARKRPSE